MDDDDVKKLFMGLNDVVGSKFALHVMDKKAIAEGEEAAKREVDRTMKRVAQGKGPKSCGTCYSTSGLMRCKKCYYGYYCSKEHQAEHWESHKNTCKSYKNLKLRCSICKLSKHVWTGFHGRIGDGYCCKECTKGGKNKDYNLKVYTCWRQYLTQMNELVRECMFVMLDNRSNPG